MADRGKLLILGIVGVALVTAVFGLWFQRRQRQFALDFWGAEAGLIVRDAEQVTLARLQPVDSAQDDTLRVGDRNFQSSPPRSLNGVPGLIKLRLALLENRAFETSQETQAVGQASWKYLMRFQKDGRQVSVLMDDGLERIRYHEADREAGVARISTFLMQFVRDHLPGERAALESGP